MHWTALLLSLILLVPVGALAASEEAEELLDAKCSYECQMHTRHAKQPTSERTRHEADACTCACYHRSSPVGDPDKALFRECAVVSTRAAHSLGSQIADPKLD